MAAGRIALEAEVRLPRKDAPVVLYDNGEGLVPAARESLAALGYTNIRELAGGLKAWARGRLRAVPGRQLLRQGLWRAGRVTPAHAVAAGRRRRGADFFRRRHRDSRRPPLRRIRHHEHPGLGQRARRGAGAARRQGRAEPETTIVVNCAGRTRSIIGTQSLINAGVPNKVVALRNGTIGWTLASTRSSTARAVAARSAPSTVLRHNARDVAYRAGVRRIGLQDFAALQAQAQRTLYRFDVRDAEEYASRPPQGFPPLRRRTAGAGDRHGRAGARRAHRAVGRQGHPRRHDRIMARANGF